MIQESVQYLTEKEEEFVNLLIKIGMKKNGAKVLVFLEKTPEATSRDIERGANLRQPEVRTGIKYLATQGWVKCREIPNDKKARSLIQYSLAIPVKEIIASIEKKKKIEANNQLDLIRKMRCYI